MYSTMQRTRDLSFLISYSIESGKSKCPIFAFEFIANKELLASSCLTTGTSIVRSSNKEAHGGRLVVWHSASNQGSQGTGCTGEKCSSHRQSKWQSSLQGSASVHLSRTTEHTAASHLFSGHVPSALASEVRFLLIRIGKVMPQGHCL